MSIKEIKYGSREEWLALRKGYIGGSDAGAVMGLNPYSSPYAVWAEKTGRIDGFAGNLTTEVGAYLEDLVADLFCRETGKKVRRKNRMLVNSQYPWACADVDRVIVGEKALLEIKTTNSLPAMKKLRGGEYPETWYCQMVHYLAVTEMDRAYLAVLINCRELRIFTLDRDDEEIAALMAEEESFWQNVKKDVPPHVDGMEATTQAIMGMHPESDGTTAFVFGLDNLLNRRALLQQSKKDLEADITEIDNQIKAGMANADRAECDWGTVTWKSQTRSSFDRKAMERDHPEIDLDKYYKTTASRVFRVTENKNKEDVSA